MSNIQFKEANKQRFNAGRGRAKIEYIVMHYTANNGDTAKGNIDYFANNSDVASSAHYFVDEYDVVYQSVKDTDTAWHCGGRSYRHPLCRNVNSIGIEMCSRKDSKGVYYIKPETVANAVKLVKELMAKYNIPAEKVLRHYDITGKECPEPFVRNKKQWRDFLERLTDKQPAAHKSEGDTFEKDLDTLVKLGIISTPDYWQAQKGADVKEFICQAVTNGRLDKRINNGITDINTAINVLIDAGVIKSSESVKNGIENIKYYKELLINVANKSKIVLQKIVHAEAAGEGPIGQLLVANIILNRQKSPSFPNGIYEIVFQNTEDNGKKIYQFTPVTDGAYMRANPSNSVIQAVEKALNGEDASKGALYFCTKESAKKPGNWHERALDFTMEHGGHRFYKTKAKI